MRKGQLGMNWIYGLILIVVLGVMFIIFNTVFADYLIPQSTTLINTSGANSTFVNTAMGEQAKVMTFWSFIPYVILFFILIYFIKQAMFKKE